jgi:hypothetical protein
VVWFSNDGLPIFSNLVLVSCLTSLPSSLTMTQLLDAINDWTGLVRYSTREMQALGVNCRVVLRFGLKLKPNILRTKWVEHLFTSLRNNVEAFDFSVQSLIIDSQKFCSSLLVSPSLS